MPFPFPLFFSYTWFLFRCRCTAARSFPSLIGHVQLSVESDTGVKYDDIIKSPLWCTYLWSFTYEGFWKDCFRDDVFLQANPKVSISLFPFDRKPMETIYLIMEYSTKAVQRPEPSQCPIANQFISVCTITSRPRTLVHIWNRKNARTKNWILNGVMLEPGARLTSTITVHGKYGKKNKQLLQAVAVRCKVSCCLTQKWLD